MSGRDMAWAEEALRDRWIVWGSMTGQQEGTSLLVNFPIFVFSFSCNATSNEAKNDEKTWIAIEAGKRSGE